MPIRHRGKDKQDQWVKKAEDTLENRKKISQRTKEQSEVLRNQRNKYMEDHFKSLDDKVEEEECMFSCGKIKEPNEDMCEDCIKIYTKS